jgi:hypothetical protein
MFIRTVPEIVPATRPHFTHCWNRLTSGAVAEDVRLSSVEVVPVLVVTRGNRVIDPLFLVQGLEAPPKAGEIATVPLEGR